MADPTNSGPLRPAGRRALAAYVLGWALTGAIAAVLVVTLLRGGGGDDVTLPPVRETELSRAAQRAGCELRDGSLRDEPVTDGRPARPARAGFYDEPRPASELAGALRRGIVVISFRRDLPEDRREQLEVVQRAVPAGTIVVRNDRMRYTLAISAYRRRLGCRRVMASTLDAVRLFRGRYVGSGPDSPR